MPLTITFDEDEEINETIVFALENPTGATLGTSVHSVTINADILQEKRRVWEWVFEPVLALKGRLG